MGLITEIKKQLFEELGVSDKVTKAAKDIFKAIIYDSKLHGRAKNKSGAVQYSFDGIDVDVIYYLYYVRTVEDFDDSKFIANSDMVSPKHFIVRTTVLYDYSQNKYVDPEGSLQHELEHVYQQASSGNLLLQKEKSRDIYRISERLINSERNSERIVGFIVYYNNRFEKDAIANEFYKTIMDNPNENPFELLKSSKMYNNLKVIEKVIVNTNKYKNTFEKIAFDNFGKHYDWLKNMATSICKAYTIKIGKIMAKAHNDLYANGTQLDGDTFFSVKGKKIYDN